MPTDTQLQYLQHHSHSWPLLQTLEPDATLGHLHQQPAVAAEASASMAASQSALLTNGCTSWLSCLHCQPLPPRHAKCAACPLSARIARPCRTGCCRSTTNQPSKDTRVHLWMSTQPVFHAMMLLADGSLDRPFSSVLLAVSVQEVRLSQSGSDLLHKQSLGVCIHSHAHAATSSCQDCQ
ncbi:hypothetical protein BC831DRAFT_259884 [Entophlyctis helioformis]|nr:hypothetical protein BC831DRAFT_259884 [Entophlyctis helioformis]